MFFIESTFLITYHNDRAINDKYLNYYEPVGVEAILWMR